jgi:hypothetical protein
MADRQPAHDQRSWRPKRVEQPATTGRPTRGRIYALAIALLVLAGTVIALLFWLRPIQEAYFLGIWIDQYADARIPYASWVNEDRDSLLALPWRDKDDRNPFARQHLHLLRELFQNLQGREGRPLVVYVNAYALANDEEVFILPGDAKLEEPKSWLPLGDLLKGMHNSSAHHKLLILDIMRPLSAPRLGLLEEDVAGRAWPRLQAAVEEDPALAILCACSAEQSALGLGVARHSLFSFYLEQGLHGRADGWNDKQRSDGRVSMRELAAYVSARVDRWSLHCRGVRQTPMLLAGKVKDFPLVLSQDWKADSPAEETESEAYPEWLLKRWQLLDVPAGSSDLSIPTRSRLMGTLLQAELHWRQGMTPERITPQVDEAAAAFDTERQQRQKERDGAPLHSLAEALANRVSLADAEKSGVLSKLEDLAKLDGEARAAKPDDKKEIDKKSAAIRSELIKAYQDKPLDLAWLVWQATAKQVRPGRDQIRSWDSLLATAWRDLPSDLRPRLAEIDFLHQLAGWPGPDGKAWPAELIHDALLVLWTREQTRAFPDEEGEWFKSLRTAANEKWSEGSRMLMQADPVAWETAVSRIRAAQSGYDQLYRYLQLLRQARQARDEAMVLLPQYARSAELNDGLLDGWLAAVEAVSVLQQLLTKTTAWKTPDLPGAPSELDDATRTLRRTLDKLARPEEVDRIKALITEGRKLDPSIWKTMDALLAGPGLTAAKRAELWQARRDLSQRLHVEILERDDKEDRAGAIQPPRTAVRASGSPRRDAVRRGRVSIGLLQLANRQNVAELNEALRRATENPKDARAWSEFCQNLRDAWAQQP